MRKRTMDIKLEGGQFRLTERQEAELFSMARDRYLAKKQGAAEAWLNLMLDVLDWAGYDVVKRERGQV